MKRLLCALCLAIVALGATALPALAANFTWIGGASQDFGDWNNWDPNWFWTYDTLRIDDNSDTTSPILSNLNLQITQLYLGSLSSSDPGVEFTPPTTTGGMLTISEWGTLLVDGKIDVGAVGPVAGESKLILTGGAIQEDGTTSGGTITQGAAEFRVGVLNNTGTLDMSGASRINHTAGGSIFVGALEGGVGKLNMTDNAVINIHGTNLYIGYQGGAAGCTGELNMSGAANIGVDWGNVLHVGYGAGSTGTAKLSGGAGLGWFAGHMFIGEAGGTGTLELTNTASIYQNSGEANYGYQTGSQGNLVMTGSDTVVDEYPTIHHVGTTLLGRNGGKGTATITNAAYWASSSHVYVGIGSGGDGTMTLDTTPGSVNAAKLTVGGHLYVGYEAAHGELNINGASQVVVDNWIPVAFWDGGTTPDAVGVVNMNGGTLTKTNLANTYVALGMGGTGTWNQNGGVAMINAPTVLGNENAAGGGTGILNLNGGVYNTTRIYNGYSGVGNAHGRVNFNGGTLQVNTTGFEFIPGGNFIELRGAHDFIASVMQGGAMVDTNAGNVIIPVPLQHDAAVGAPEIDGGLTKLGQGTLVMSASSTYTGPTVVNDGVLQLKPTFLVPHQEAYVAPGTVGTRSDGPYSLGRNFNANSPIQVTQLGVFDSGGDGLAGAHVVHLTNAADLSDTAVTFTPAAPGTYENGYRFIALDTPLSLNPGSYLIWVDTLGGADIFGDFSSGMSISYDTGPASEITLGAPVYDLTVGTVPTYLWTTAVNGEASVSFVYYNPGGVITANLLPVTTPVVMGGPAGSAPSLDLQGADQRIASLADVAGAEVFGVVTNSAAATPVVLTLSAASGTTTYSGAIDGDLSLVKDGESVQILTGPLTYTGDTTVNAGTLSMTNLNTPGSAVSVAAGATLSATSITADSLTVGGGPFVAAGAPNAVPEPGTLALLILAALGCIALLRRK